MCQEPVSHLAAAGSRSCCSPRPARAAGPHCSAWVSRSPSREAWPARSPQRALASGARTAGTRTLAGTRRRVRHHTAGSLPTMHQSTEGRPGLCPAYLQGHTHTCHWLGCRERKITALMMCRLEDGCWGLCWLVKGSQTQGGDSQCIPHPHRVSHQCIMTSTSKRSLGQATHHLVYLDGTSSFCNTL